MEFSVSTLLATIALGLMVVLTGGVVYLTAADWRDRRRRQNLVRPQPLPTPQRSTTTKREKKAQKPPKAKGTKTGTKTKGDKTQNPKP
ncbi:MAG: hypothetical protein ACO4AI_00560 [Prochlorothrix sp.]